jgi:hypothetical protein
MSAQRRDINTLPAAVLTFGYGAAKAVVVTVTVMLKAVAVVTFDVKDAA